MIHSQLQVTNQQIDQESKVNWETIKKLYHQTLKPIHNPQPHNHTTAHLPHRPDVQTTFYTLLQQLERKNSQLICSTQQHFQQKIQKLQDRVQKLQQLLLYSLHPQIQATASNNKPIVQNSNNSKRQLFSTPVNKPFREIKQTQTTEMKPTQSKQHIYIQEGQDNDVSLLEDEQEPFVPQVKRNSIRSSHKRTVSNKQGQRRRQPYFNNILQNLTEQEYKPHFNNKVYTVDCIFHQKMLKDLRQELQVMKNCVQKAHNVSLKDVKDQQDNQIGVGGNLEKKYQQKWVYSLSTNAQKHLLNQNAKLRQIVQKYRKELFYSKGEVKNIKLLLKQALQLPHSRQL